MVAAARQIVATSENRGRPYRQSHPMTVAPYSSNTTGSHITQYTFMLSLEVMGPGGSLSMLLLLRHVILVGGNGDGDKQLQSEDKGSFFQL
jgi:hypothetical protein